MEESKKLLIAEALQRVVDNARSGPKVRVGLMASGSELGSQEIIQGGMLAMEEHSNIQVVFIGPKPALIAPELEWIETSDCEADVIAALEKALKEEVVSGAVAMHYPFPIGVTTIGRIYTPGQGKPMFIASCTGSSASLRTESMLRNAIYGNAVAKAAGIAEPKLAFLNLDGAGVALRSLKRLEEKGYKIQFGSSNRSDKSPLLRGNDLVSGAVDVLVCDTLTGNALVKVFSTFTTGGTQEIQGWGYGPSVGENWQHIVSIISRASGAPVIANALALTGKLAQNHLQKQVETELKAAMKSGLSQEIEDLRPKAQVEIAAVKMPTKVPVGAQISGVDVMDMDNAVQALWKLDIYAESAMGCTGPVILVQDNVKENAMEILKKASFI